jgi:type II secretory pathway pseudopilin PulG
VAVGGALAAFAAALGGHHSPPPSPVSSGDSSATLIVSILALVVSIVSLVATTWIGYRQTRAQDALKAIEEARRSDELSGQRQAALQARSAAVTAQWQDTGPALIVHNRGQAPAIDVTVEVTSATPGGLPPRLPSGDDRLAMERLEPGQSHAIPLTAPYGMAAVIQAAVRWRDGAGPHEDIVRLPTVGE